MKLFTKILSVILLISMLASFSGCEKIEEFFGDEEEEDTKPGEETPSIGETDPRKPGVYTFLLVREGRTLGTAASFAVCEMDISIPSLSILQIPGNLLINDSKATSLAELYDASYDSALASNLSRDESTMNAAKAVSSFVSENMSVPIDYHLVLSKNSVEEYIDLIDGIEVDFPFTFTTTAGITYSAGVRKITGRAAYDFTEYQYFRDTESQINAERAVLAGVHAKLCETLSSENISVHMILGKPLLATDVPSDDGYDIFFLRKLIAVTPENWNVTNLCTTPASIASGDFEVMHRNRALEQINTFMKVYNNDVNEEFFDPELKFTNTNEKIVNAIYKANKSLPESYSAADIYAGRLRIFTK
ncbi:MAG: LCP family protein [Clostridia bacterium]|nr:LCP family protein [Clostridia bacterium]